MSSRGNQQVLKEINKSLLLHLIHRHGSISRIELARETKLSPTTVSILIEEFIREGIVHEVGKSGSGLGRKMKLLAIRGEGGYSLGVDLSNSPSRYVLLNMHGDIVAKQEFDRLIGEDSIRSQLGANISGFLNGQNINRDLVRWMGISVPGRLDEKRELVTSASYLGLSNFPLKQMLEESEKIPVHLINDLDAAGFAERFSGTAKGKRTLVYILIDYGVGAGLVLDDRIYHGHTGQAGRTPELSPYNTETIARTLKEQFGSTLGNKESPEDILDVFLELVRQREEPYYAVGEQIKERIAKYVAGIVQFINPEQLILSGWITRCPEFLEGLTRLIERYEMSKDAPTPVLSAHWKQYGAAIGAATLGLHQVLGMKTIN